MLDEIVGDTIDEHEVATVAATITDPGVDDVFEIDVDDVGPALRYATAKVNRVQRGGGGFGADSGGAAPTEDPWTTGGTTDNFDEPPF